MMTLLLLVFSLFIYLLFLLCRSLFVCLLSFFFFFFKQKTAYEMRISDWSSDVCSSDLRDPRLDHREGDGRPGRTAAGRQRHDQPPQEAHAPAVGPHGHLRPDRRGGAVGTRASEGRLELRLALQHLPDFRPAAGTDRESRARLARGGGRPGRDRLSLLRRRRFVRPRLRGDAGRTQPQRRPRAARTPTKT